jgi:hypothetical protein
MNAPTTATHAAALRAVAALTGPMRFRMNRYPHSPTAQRAAECLARVLHTLEPSPDFDGLTAAGKALKTAVETLTRRGGLWALTYATEPDRRHPTDLAGMESDVRAAAGYLRDTCGDPMRRGLYKVWLNDALCALKRARRDLAAEVG